MAKSPKILMVAGELSGDYHAAHLVSEIRNVRADVEIVGFGSRRMKESGVRLIADTTDWGGIGVFDNLLKIGKTATGFRLFQKTLIEEKPDVFVPVDFRFFN
ncbi:MAG: lipid-A-disaccharide synthase, partial [bacterium]